MGWRWVRNFRANITEYRLELTESRVCIEVFSAGHSWPYSGAVLSRRGSNSPIAILCTTWREQMICSLDLGTNYSKESQTDIFQVATDYHGYQISGLTEPGHLV